MHTLDRVMESMSIFVEEIVAEQSRMKLAEYVVFDALIGNTDRHHENWGALLQKDGKELSGSLSPTFDHASSMGRELQDVKRLALLQNNTVDRYVERARGAIYWSEDDVRGVSPLELVRRAVTHDKYADLFSSAIAKTTELSQDSFCRIIAKIPNGWMSQPARDFTLEVLCYNHNQLKNL